MSKLKVKKKVLVSNALLLDLFNTLGTSSVAYFGTPSSHKLTPLNTAAQRIMEGFEQDKDIIKEKYKPRIVDARLKISNPKNNLLLNIHKIWVGRGRKSAIYVDKITWIEKEAYYVHLEPVKGKISIKREMRNLTEPLITLDELINEKGLSVYKEWPDGTTEYNS